MHPQKPYPIDTRLQSCRRSVTRARRRATERGVPAQDARTGEAVVLFPRRVACGSGVVAEEGGGDLVSERTTCGKDRLQLGAGRVCGTSVATARGCDEEEGLCGR